MAGYTKERKVQNTFLTRGNFVQLARGCPNLYPNRAIYRKNGIELAIRQQRKSVKTPVVRNPEEIHSVGGNIYHNINLLVVKINHRQN